MVNYANFTTKNKIMQVSLYGCTHLKSHVRLALTLTNLLKQLFDLTVNIKPVS